MVSYTRKRRIEAASQKLQFRMRWKFYMDVNKRNLRFLAGDWRLSGVTKNFLQDSAFQEAYLISSLPAVSTRQKTAFWYVI